MIEMLKNETRKRKEEVFCDFIQRTVDRFVNVVDDETAVNFEIYEATRLIFVPHFSLCVLLIINYLVYWFLPVI